MAISLGGFSGGGGGGAGTDTLDDVTGRGSSTANSITVGGVSIGTEYTLPTADGSSNQFIKTDGAGALSFAALDITGGLEYKTSYDAQTNSPLLTNAEKGDFYVISAGGTRFGRDWSIGDHLLINEDMGGVVSNGKIDKIDNTDTPASETVSGVIEIATDAEAAAATATNKALVPSNISSLDLADMDNTTSGFLSDITAERIGFLSDVTITGAVNGDLLSYSAGEWVNNTSTSDFLASTAGIDDLSDVTITGAANGEVLSYNGSAWVNSAASAGSLAGLSDVTITAPASSEYLRYNGSAWVDAALSIADDTTPQLSGPLDTNGNAITSASNANVSINPDGTGDISIGADLIPDADATHSIGDEDNRYISTYSDLNGAIRFKAKNDEGSAITAGQAVYIKGLAGDGTTPTVGLADADDAAKMPAFGLAFAGANDNAEVQVVSFGNLNGLNTSTFSVGDTLYVSTTAGALVSTPPAGETALIQNIGRVVRSDNGAGVIKVGGAGRSAATPNLDSGKIFLGNGSNQAVSTALSSINLSSFNNDSGFITSVASASETVEGIIEIATNAEAAAATATDRALVPSNIASLDLSDMDNTTSGFITDVVSDTTPQLGGSLDVNGQDIISVSNGDIEVDPNGTGSFKIKGNATSGSGRLVLNCEQNTHGITLKGPPHSAAASYTLTFPNTDGTADQVLKTDGSGALDWVDQASGGGGWTYSAITADPANAQASYHYSCTGTFTITLATSGMNAGEEIRVKNMGTGTITIDPQTSTIDGSTTDYEIDVQYSAITLVSTGANWEII